jgi:hypothetical protein
MKLKETPLHFNPLRPCRSHLEAVTWSGGPVQRSTDRSPFAYLHEPYLDVDTDPVFSQEDIGHYDRETQRWQYPNDPVELGVWTKTRKQPSKSPPSAKTHDQPDYDTVTDDACM